jgi:hypothetical protein
MVPVKRKSMASVKLNPRIRLDAAVLTKFWQIMWENVNGDPELARMRRDWLESEGCGPIWGRVRWSPARWAALKAKESR